MSGSGRRSQYRKHLTDAVLHDFPEPREGEQVAEIVATRGGNQFEIQTPTSKSPQLAILPTKFHKLVWIKRKDYVIVQGAEEEEGGGIRYLIKHVLYKEQIKHLKSKGLWPSEFGGTKDDEGDDEESTSDKGDKGDEKAVAAASSDGIVYDYDLVDRHDDIFVNTNRMAQIKIQNSESDSSSGDEA
jgi:probable RNA-binding protein EIF1AD